MIHFKTGQPFQEKQSSSQHCQTYLPIHFSREFFKMSEDTYNLFFVRE